MYVITYANHKRASSEEAEDSNETFFLQMSFSEYCTLKQAFYIHE